MKITYKFYLRDPDNSGTKFPVCMQITSDRKSTKRKIGFELFVKEWDSDKQRAKKNLAVNSKIQLLESKLTDLQYDLQKNPKELSVTEIADIILKEKSNSDLLLDFFEDRMLQENDRGIFTKGTFKHYKSCQTHLGNFIFAHYKLKDIPLNKVDLKFIETFDAFLIKRNLSRNTINSNYHKKLKTTLSHAIKNNLIEKNPYEIFKLKVVNTQRDFLTQEELIKMQSFDFSHNLSLDRVRDLFVFSCYTGLRFSDAQDLNQKDVHLSETESYIYRKQNKTKEVVQIPLYKIAIDILKKYDNDERKITNKMLPQISNQKLNAYLKTIGDIIGIQKTLTHHVARHTCATILLNQGVSLSVVQQILGHENIRTTQNYAKLQNRTVKTEALGAFNNMNNGKQGSRSPIN
jgi:site-specific recombinase XerD